MKLGTQTASLTNHLQSRMVKGQPEPAIGMAATILAWTDRYAATVVAVDAIRGRCRIKVQRDKARRADLNGPSECQEYEYEPDEFGAVYVFRRAATGQWREVRLNAATGRWNAVAGYGLRLGARDEYRDFSF